MKQSFQLMPPKINYSYIGHCMQIIDFFFFIFIYFQDASQKKELERISDFSLLLDSDAHSESVKELNNNVHEAFN